MVKKMKKNIIGIPVSHNLPPWQSSTLPPEYQLSDLGRRGSFVDGFRDYNYDQDLADFIKGKRIAYICPSPHLRGKKLGAWIDSHDLVVRVNQSFHMTEDLWEDYGKRTDILMNCMNIHKMNALYENMEFAKSLQYIVCPMVSMWDIGRVNTFLDDIGVPWHNVCDGYLFKVFRQVGTTCNTGLMGIMTLLNYDIKEVFVGGMSFFNMNKFGKIYFDKYHDEAAANSSIRDTADKIPNIADLRIDIHQQQPQIDYFAKILNVHYPDKLKVDDYLIQNFNLQED
tara:strand:- start:2978 stop:3826 length:849 start_codon:yes stop_codon:yes gene_type:complete